MQWLKTKTIEQAMADSDEPGRQLKRTLGVFDLMILGVAVAVGAGIFSVGARAAGSFAGPAVIFSFVLAALTCAMATMCYAEFASSVPVTGSAYTYTYLTMGEGVAWIIGWNLLLEMISAGAVIAKYWGIYLSTIFATAGLHVPSTLHLGRIDMEWGPFVIVAVFTALLMLGTKASARVNNLFTLIKIAITLFVIVVGFTYVDLKNYTPFVPPAQPPVVSHGVTGDIWGQPMLAWLFGAQPSQYGWLGVISGASLVFFAFIGFDVVATSAEEVKDPQKTLPRGIFGGLAMVTVLYILVTLALTGMVPYTELAKAENPSLATAFISVGANWAAQVIAVGVLMGLTTVVMVLLMGSARILLALCRDGLLPRSWSVTSATRKTPVRLQLLVGVIIAALAGFTKVEMLEEMINIGTLSAFVLVSIGILVLRKKRPDLPRGYSVPWVPVVPVLSALLCTYLALNLTTLTWLRFLGWMAIGVVIYLAYGMRHSRLR
ncbi:amino acid permease [Comamonas resistens]|uniref:Amino acid permease n=1 Tax=Comamonas resistens TaxID=3046670 RepID=A0ABY8SQQ7_9BURK|nr:amino acid permease [Comamonas resistens]MDL5036384.1 amino acid permease [Comamonas resistens]WHS64730.1 amino acid permease [Comamonas resistens]